MNDLDAFLSSYADSMLHGHPDYAGPLARMGLREFVTPLLICKLSLFCHSFNHSFFHPTHVSGMVLCPKTTVRKQIERFWLSQSLHFGCEESHRVA